MLPAAGVTYRAFVDPSGGSEDAMTLAIAHKTTSPDERVIVDAVREVRPPFSPSGVVDDFAVLLKSYRVSKVVGDHYGGEFVKEPFRRHGISYEVCKQPKSDLFTDMLPLLNSGRITLPRHDRLIAQIVGLERRVSRAGRDASTCARRPRRHRQRRWRRCRRHRARRRTIVPGVVAHHQATNCFGFSGADEQRPTMCLLEGCLRRPSRILADHAPISRECARW
jgi:hypothetical protein